MEVEDKKTKNAVSMWCGCTFHIRYTKARAKMPSAPQEAVRITDASFLHTHDCKPCVGQIQVMRNRNGHFNAGYVPSNLLQYMLQQILPRLSVVFDAQLLTNVRLKTRRLGPSCDVESMDVSPEALQELSTTTTTTMRLGDANNDPPYLDLATKYAREILREALSSDENKWKSKCTWRNLHQKKQVSHIILPELWMGHLQE